MTRAGVTRKTTRGVPVYNDTATDDVLETAVERRNLFPLNGAEDLVKADGEHPGWSIAGPRTETLFPPIEHHRDPANGDAGVQRTGWSASTTSRPSRGDATSAPDPVAVVDLGDRACGLAGPLADAGVAGGSRPSETQSGSGPTGLFAPGAPQEHKAQPGYRPRTFGARNPGGHEARLLLLQAVTPPPLSAFR
jgi:hypothetical protein